MWTGVISFGLVNIPVQLYAAVEQEALSFHLLHKKDLSPIRFARVCKEDGTEVPWPDVVKGYEIAKGQYVVMTEEDFLKADLKRTNSIEILKFCEAGSIESGYFERPYYLEPVKGSDKAYGLLREALGQSGRVGIAKVVFHNREHLAALGARDELLVLNTLRFTQDLRQPDLRLPPKTAAKSQEVKMAMQLIEQLSGPFKPEDYRDTYRQELKALIDRKSKGLPAPGRGKAPKPTRVPDLMEVLRKSLAQSTRLQAKRPSATHPEHRAVQ
jgi:DNA end-binding protein Ku